MTTDIYNKPFDDGTKIKLEIFREYLKAWLPTFLKGKNIIWKDIFIYDFFAGEGIDSQGNYGSALIIIDELKLYYSSIKENKLNIHLLLNDLDNKKISQLEKIIKQSNPNLPFNLIIKNKDFKFLFNEIYPMMKRFSDNPSLIFIDQYGIKHVNPELFKKIIELKRNDLLFFISSSFIRRFNEVKEFKNYLEISREKFEDSSPFHSHLVVSDYYKSLISDNIEYYIAPFSIQKNSNIYGLIFGSHHTFGIEKFLNICWKINPSTGNANYNIDDEPIANGQLSIFSKDNIPKKLHIFKQTLRKKILNKQICSNKQIYNFTFDFGCLPKHANFVIKELINESKIKNITTFSQKIHTLEEKLITLI